MRLQPAFEPIRVQIVNQDPVPSFDTVVALVIAEETRLRSSTTVCTLLYLCLRLRELFLLLISLP